MSSFADLRFESGEQWREWLNANHLLSDGVWLLIHKKKSPKLGIKYQEALDEALCFGWIDSKMYSVDAYSFRQRFTPRRRNSIWSKKNKQTANQLIKEGKMTKAGFLEINKAKKNGKWALAYSSKTSPEIPLKLEEALKKNQNAWKNFCNFSNSKKLQYIWWIKSAKRDETIKKRVNETVKRALLAGELLE